MKRILSLLSLIITGAIMIACVAGTKSILDEPAFGMTPECQGPNKGYYLEPLNDMMDVPLVELHADWTDIPVYGCMTADGTVHCGVYVHQINTEHRGMLQVSFTSTDEEPVLTIDYETGFVLSDVDFAKYDTCQKTDYENVVLACVDGIDETPRLYYSILDINGNPLTILPVEIRSMEDCDEISVEVADQVWMYVKRLITGQAPVEDDPTPSADFETLDLDATETPVVTEVPEETSAPVYTATPKTTEDAHQDSTVKPTATPKPETTPMPTYTPKPTAGTLKPTNTLRPTATPKPTRTPTPKPTAPPYVWKCQYCGKTFGSSDDDYERWYQHAWYDPGCYAAGHAVTPVPATPTPRPGGHYEDVWVVDVPRKTHDVWHCNVCGYESTVWYGDFDKHQTDHSHAGEGSGYHSYIVVDQEEQGHWETVWVPDP